MSSVGSIDFRQQAREYLLEGDYEKAVKLYEEVIALQPEVKSHYWHLGLLLVLQGQEEEAQITWMSAMLDDDLEQITLWTTELVEVLQAEAERREANSDYQTAWAIRQHLQEIAPENLNNLLQLVQNTIALETFTIEELVVIVDKLKTAQPEQVNQVLLLEVLERVLEYAPSYSLTVEFADTCLSYSCGERAFLDVVTTSAGLAFRNFKPDLACDLTELCLKFHPDDLSILFLLAVYKQFTSKYSEAIELAKHHIALCKSLPEKIQGEFLLLSSYLKAGGYWSEVCCTFESYKHSLDLLFKERPTDVDVRFIVNLLSSSFFLSHIGDKLHENRQLQNKIANYSQNTIQEIYTKAGIEKYRHPPVVKGSKKKFLKIGYMSHCFRHHSVGWLCRWVFKYHNSDEFQVHSYLLQSKKDDSLQNWIVSSSYKSWDVSTLYGADIADRIYEDEIDILIDLDSVTSDIGCEVLALKPAPVQITWLGLDASGLPAIDYFIVDPYVLPESAQTEYAETLWRLPQTYIAVDGFEVGIPTLRREQLNIPNDAVVYLSSQVGFKRHPETVRWQVKIIKEVPNSYFLIKGAADENSLKQFFEQMAEEEGVAGDRLRFLPPVGTEVTHRANLAIADIVLDTYPYNGATTTLETLWMGIPLVTRVGEQFAARNSYTMMMNVGVTEGIAWTDEEYIEWGIRLGKDPILRQQITRRLLQSRQTSPLWNAEQFTRELEKAYQQMWAKYVETNAG